MNMEDTGYKVKGIAEDDIADEITEVSNES